MHETLLVENNNPNLRVYAVWVPKLKAEVKHVAAATTLMPDSRTVHYWDGKSALINSYTAMLKMPEDAWDIYTVYAPGTRWEGENPPEPTYWMHQLGTASAPRVDGPYFDAGAFADKVKQYLK